MSKLLNLFYTERDRLMDSDISIMFHKEKCSLTYLDSKQGVLKVVLSKDIKPLEMFWKINNTSTKIWERGVDDCYMAGLPEEFKDIAERFKSGEYEKDIKRRSEYER